MGQSRKWLGEKQRWQDVERCPVCVAGRKERGCYHVERSVGRGARTTTMVACCAGCGNTEGGMHMDGQDGRQRQAESRGGKRGVNVLKQQELYSG